ncbi:MAG: hypothetical protein ACD_79C00598G0001 [uncultured bacterium]|nr:MAG: hypothetical protein ACD_79C00598G0001 [uncultured bacterium]
MTTSGLILLIFTWSFIITLLVFCFYKVLTKKEMD